MTCNDSCCREENGGFAESTCSEVLPRGGEREGGRRGEARRGVERRGDERQGIAERRGEERRGEDWKRT